MGNTSEANLAELLTLHRQIDPLGNTFYFDNKGLFHREHGPAIVYRNGSCRWYIHGKFQKESIFTLDENGVGCYQMTYAD